MYDVRALNELVAKESAFVEKIMNEVGKVVVGQNIGAYAHGFTSGFVDLRDDSVQLFLAPGGEHDACALRGKRLGGRFANA